MEYTNLTNEEKWEMIGIQITKDYPKLVKDYIQISSYGKQQFEDLLPFCLEQLLTKKSIDYIFKLVVVDKALPNWLGRSMSLNLRSSTSPFWNHYRKEMYSHRGVYLTETPKQLANGEYDEISIEVEEDNFECMLKALNQLDFYYKPLITDYYINKLTYQQLHQKYNISLKHLKQAVDEGVEIMKQHCKHFINK